MSKVTIVESGFADEAAGSHKGDDKPFVQQVGIALALGLPMIDLRFAQFDGETKNVMDWDDDEIAEALGLLQDYGLWVGSIGSPVGKTTLPVDEAAFLAYLEGTVNTACDRADSFNTPLVRGFAFYPNAGVDRAEQFTQARDYVARIGERMRERGKILCLELESGLFGQSGVEIAEICSHANNPHVCGLFDGANAYVQQPSGSNRQAATIAEWRAMADCQGPVMHLKGFQPPSDDWVFSGQEETLRHFTPIDCDDTGHEVILQEFAARVPTITQRYALLGVAVAILVAEPHLKGGGQFGGYSGPDGFAEAIRANRRVYEKVGIQTSHTAGWSHIQDWKKDNQHLQ